MSSLVLLYSARTWYGTWLGPVVWGGLVSRSLLRICPRTASTLFFFMWSMSTVVQVDSDKVIVTQFERRKNRSALPRFIFHSAFTHTRGLSSKRRQNKTKSRFEYNPFFSFHSGREWVLFLEDSHFLKCYVIFAKCAFAWEQIRAILGNNLNSSLKLFILLFIPPCLTQPSLPSSLSLKRTDLCTAVQFLHCIGLFPSTCACGVSAPLCCLPAVQPQTHSNALHSHLYFIVTSCDVLEGGAASYSLCSDNEISPTLKGI